MSRVLSATAIVTGLLCFATPSPAQDTKMKFEMYKGKDDQFRWRLKAANGAVLATAGQGYKAAADARHGIELLQKAGTDEKVKFEVYEDEKKEHRWRVKAANGQVVATSSEGYRAKTDAEKAVAAIKAGAAKAEIVDVKE